MNAPPAKRSVAVISACMTRTGLPDLARSEVEVTAEEFENGAHYALAQRRLFAAGYEEPFVHFSDAEAPAFLLPAVRRHVGIGDAKDNHKPKEE
jgi:hypothetical protein